MVSIFERGRDIISYFFLILYIDQNKEFIPDMILTRDLHTFEESKFQIAGGMYL